MARKLDRIKIRKDFLRVASGRRFATPGLVLQAISNLQAADVGTDSSRRRLGFTATKKIGNAVVRNRAKRRLRAAAQAVMIEHATPNYDYVLIARDATSTRNWALLLDDLERALRQMQVYEAA